MVHQMDEDNNHMEDSYDLELLRRDPLVEVRVGDEYQAEIPPMMSESKRLDLLLNPLALDLVSDVGLPVQVMWIDNSRTKHGDDNVDMNESLRSLKAKRSCRSENNGTLGSKTQKKQRMNLEPLPEKPSSSWDDFEVDCFVLGLYTFGKNFTQVKNFLERKETGDILSFYYGKFYKSAKHKTWCKSLRRRSRKCIQGKKLYSGWRLQQVLSRLIPNISDELQKQMLINVSKSFAEGNTSLEKYISTVKELVGLRSLVEGVGIGKEKKDLTVMKVEPFKAKKWFTISSKASSVAGLSLRTYASLTSVDIIKQLTCGSRLSKTRCNEIFWEAVWPRLQAKGWRSEQPKDRGNVRSKEYFVFLVPGVKKFSRRKLVKRDHYFDSISDIVSKVASEPELLEFQTEEIKAANEFISENTCDQLDQERFASVSQQHCHHSSPGLSRDETPCMKFNAVGTSLATGRKLRQSLVSESKTFRGDKDSCVDSQEVENRRMMMLDEQKPFHGTDERKWQRNRIKKLVYDPMRFTIVDTSVENGEQSSGMKRRRNLAVDERKGLCPISDMAKDYSLKEPVIVRPKRRKVQKQEPNGLCSISDLDTHCSFKEQGTLHKHSSSEQQKTNVLCSMSDSNKKCSSDDLETTQQTKQPIQLPLMSGSYKSSPSAELGSIQELSSLEQRQEDHNQHVGTDIPRRQSSRKRPLTTRALEALESSFLTAESMKSTSKPNKRERSTKIKLSSKGVSENGGENSEHLVERGFLVKKATISKPPDEIEDSEPSFLVNKATMTGKSMDQIEGPEKVISFEGSFQAWLNSRRTLESE